MSVCQNAWDKLSNGLAKMEELLNKVVSFCQQHNYQAYFVGGFVRDWLLNRQTADVDIAVAGNALRVAQEVAKEVKGKYVLLDEANQIARVIVTENSRRWQLDFSTFSGEIEADLARRDFTIDAMAVKTSQWGEAVDKLVVIDPYNGRNDLKEGKIRFVTEGIFEADPVRLLRAVHLSAELSFVIDSQTEVLLRRYSQLITKVSGERVREELLRLLALPVAAGFIGYLDKLGLLTQIIPELAESKGVQQPKEHFWNVFDHSVETIATAEYLLREREWRYGNDSVLAGAPWSETIKEHFSQKVSKDSDRRTMLKLAGLLHDIAKPSTKTVDSKGKTRFLGHAKEGAAMATAILERLRFSNREIELVGNLIYHHLRPAQMTNGELPTHRAIYRYFRDVSDAGIDILFLALADYLATRGPNLNLEEWQGYCRLINYVLERYFKQKEVPPPKLVDGHDLMSIFNLKPGKEVGKILEMIKEAQAVGRVTTKEEALAFARKKLGLREITLGRIK